MTGAAVASICSLGCRSSHSLAAWYSSWETRPSPSRSAGPRTIPDSPVGVADAPGRSAVGADPRQLDELLCREIEVASFHEPVAVEIPARHFARPLVPAEF